MNYKALLKKAKKTNKIDYLSKTKYLYYYQMLAIDEKAIVLESQHGNNLHGNIFYLAKTLNDGVDYQSFRCYLIYSKKSKKQYEQLKEKYHLHRMELVRLGSLKYYQLMASAKYLLNDTSFLPFFIKKEGQVYLNTWHGTPLKTLGKKVENDYHNIGNVQKNFFMCDYLLYPNEYMEEHMVEDYMLQHLYQQDIVLGGYPRNTVFYDEVRKREIRREYALEDQEIFVYMPTYRGKVGKVETQKQNAWLTEQLMMIDDHLQENQVLYVNLHPFVSNDIHFDQFKKIKKFPKDIETYEFLSIADTLITDYSSVFFDFAVTKKKIILFTYDEEDYLAERGMYLSMHDLPFPQVKTTEALLTFMNLEKNYDDTEFLKTYCPYENLFAAKDLCDLVLFNKRERLSIHRLAQDHQEKVLIYTGNLAKNGITSSLKNLLNHLDVHEKHYYLTFNSYVIRNNRTFLKELPEGIDYIATTGKMNASVSLKYQLMRYRQSKISMEDFERNMKDLYQAEYRRHYAHIHFDHVIQFNGYEFRKILLYSQAQTDRIIYVHSDMVKEIENRQNQHLTSLKYAYQNYDKIAVVSEGMIKPTAEICGVDRDYHVVHNFINYQDVLEKSTWPLLFDKNTTCTVDEDTLHQILESSDKKFITIGRYSPEKGHARLIDAFIKIHQEDPHTYLLIIGGHGKEYQATLDKVQSLDCQDHIVLIRSMSNPYALLKKCDYFVLSSLYEGFGLVLAEADIVGLPVISTDIDGPRAFMKQNGGRLVENSEEGIYQGMKELLQGNVPCMNVDYEAYNQQALKELYQMLEG